MLQDKLDYRLYHNTYSVINVVHNTCYSSTPLYSAFTETGATQTMKTSQKAELIDSNIFKSSQSIAQYKTMNSQLVR